MAIALLARLYPTISLAGPQAECNRLSDTARSINPAIAFATQPDVAILVGTDVRSPARTIIHATSDGWFARISRSSLPTPADSANPFGAAAAACLACANVFRAVFGVGGEPLLDNNLTLSTVPGISEAATREPVRFSRRDVLVGAGAVGSAFLWTLARTLSSGEITVVDPERVELGNIQRYVNTGMNDIGMRKVDLAARTLKGTVSVRGLDTDWSGLVGMDGHSWDRVLIAVDSAAARRDIQATLPNWIANAWTQAGDLGVSVHRRFGKGACVRCLYLPEGELPSEDDLVASALGVDIDSHGLLIRQLLHTGESPPPAFLDEVAVGLDVERQILEPFASMPLRSLYIDGVCGGSVISLDRVGALDGQIHVPLAHQSALAGVLLAAAVASGIATDTRPATEITRLNLLEPIGEEVTVVARREPRGICICHDPGYVTRYEAKYPL